MTEVIRAADLPTSRWVNGAGRKADIAAGDGWLMGFAWLDGDAPFSDYTGFDRTIMLLEGHGFTLELPEGSTVSVTDPFVPTAFSGAGPIACRLIAGPCRVLNAISAYPGFSHTLQLVSGADLAAVEPGERTFAVVLRGEVGGARPFDTVRLTERLAAPAGALLAVVQFENGNDP